MLRVIQLSDTHFLEEGEAAEGGGAYDTAAAFEEVLVHADRGAHADLVVVTGDVADHGRPDQYRMAANAFAKFTPPVNVLPGNHDQDAPFGAGIGRLGVGTSRVIEAGSWCFLFVDSNAGVMLADSSGRLVDPESVDDRLHRNGSLGPRESAWIREMCATTAAEHVFIWIHHPPIAAGLSGDPAYVAEWQTLMAELPKVRGMGAGHTHVPDDYSFAGRTVFVAPSFKHNFDLRARTLLPPGYRTYEFSDNGNVASEVCLVDDERWPRQPMGRAVHALLTGELSSEQFAEIVARKRASTS